MAAVYDTILDSALAVVTALPLAGLLPASVRKRKLPSVAETLDATPCVLVSPSESPEEDVALEAEGTREVTYGVDVVIVADDNQDFVGNLGTYLLWREQIRKALSPPVLAPVTSVFDCDVRPFAPLDRRRLNESYAYSGLSFRYHSAEV